MKNIKNRLLVYWFLGVIYFILQKTDTEPIIEKKQDHIGEKAKSHSDYWRVNVLSVYRVHKPGKITSRVWKKLGEKQNLKAALKPI